MEQAPNANSDQKETIMRLHTRSIAVMGIAGVLAGVTGVSVVHGANATVVYKAELSALNAKTTGSEASGEATFTISGDRLTIRINAHEVPPNMEHLQHFHGFATGDRTSRCPTARNDVNGDDIIDIVETEPLAGTAMVPFHNDPVSMQIVNDTYPRAGAEGSYLYVKTISLKALKAAFTAKFPGQQLDRDHRVVFLHGVPPATKLPATVASLDHIPAQVTLPIACGEIRKVTE
jgi:hypothetical protein